MKTKGEYIINESSSKYKNKWLEVTEDQVTRPDGQPGIFGVVRIVDGVGVLPLDDEGFVYLTEEFHYAIERKDIEVVSGGIEAGEESLRAAQRELKEELGIEAGEWIDLGLVNPFTATVKSSQKIYLAKKLTFGDSQPEATEDIKLIKVKLDEAVKMVMDSTITHGASGVLILKAQRYLNGLN
jgi:8-oxo-dGTP pyrophosphatase MutT (NUDIX family)